jgi:hypothetical protein
MKRTNRRKESCPVAALAREVRRLEDECAAADDARDTAESDRIFNQIEALRLAASYLMPTSNEGAQFQAELSGILADGMIGASRRNQFEAQRAIQRMGGAVGAFLNG